MAKKTKIKKPEPVRLYIIPEDSMTLEAIRRATKEEIWATYNSIKEGNGNNSLYVIIKPGMTISDSEQIRFASRAEIKEVVRTFK